ncbi:MAG TPA: hypothetical protein VG711_01910 [Phycisphaerales bacterium]|nr:hypothetical protein [Phycisphaerales bacterium]
MAQFTIVATVKIAHGTTEELWWLSHVSLLLTSAGLMIASPRLVFGALLVVCVPHMLWLSDALIGWTTGTFPLRMAGYLLHADFWEWAATFHHFYLLPLLMWLAFQKREIPKGSMLVACATLMLTTFCARLCFDPALNVNFSQWVMPRVQAPIVRWTDHLPGPAYLLFINLWAAIFFCYPVSRMIRRGQQWRLFTRAAAQSSDE